jgi:hypothetical protein
MEAFEMRVLINLPQLGANRDENVSLRVYRRDLFAGLYKERKETLLLQPQETAARQTNVKLSKSSAAVAIYSSRYQTARGPFAFPFPMAAFIIYV